MWHLLSAAWPESDDTPLPSRADQLPLLVGAAVLHVLDDPEPVTRIPRRHIKDLAGRAVLDVVPAVSQGNELPLLVGAAVLHAGSAWQTGSSLLSWCQWAITSLVENGLFSAHRPDSLKTLSRFGRVHLRRAARMARTSSSGASSAAGLTGSTNAFLPRAMVFLYPSRYARHVRQPKR
jgi:hypothetical protein